MVDNRFYTIDTRIYIFFIIIVKYILEGGKKWKSTMNKRMKQENVIVYLFGTVHFYNALMQ